MIHRSRISTNTQLFRPAFSLIELSVVLLLMAITAAVAAPRWTAALQQFRARSAAHRLAADLSLARRHATITSGNQSVDFSVSTHTYWLPNMPALDRAAGTYQTRLADDPYRAQLVTLFGSTADQQVVFNGFGVPNQGGSIVVACGSAQRSVLLNINTGLAEVQE